VTGYKQIFLSGLKLVVMLLLFQGCADLERKNPLDPKNSASKQDRVVLVEAFVNDSTPFTPFALTALDYFATQVGFNAIIVQYHVPAQQYPDNFALSGALARYGFYETVNRAVPDVFFNGLNQRVQGASSHASALERFQAAMAIEAGNISLFTIEADVETRANSMVLDVRLAKLGSEDVRDVFVQAVAIENTGVSGHRFVARQIWPARSFSFIGNGKIATAKLTASIPSGANAALWKIVVFAQSSQNKETLQAILVNQ